MKGIWIRKNDKRVFEVHATQSGRVYYRRHGHRDIHHMEIERFERMFEPFVPEKLWERMKP